MTKQNIKTPVVFYVGIALLCLFMFSLYLSGGMYARYATTASGSDGARVAKFDVALDGTMSSWSGTTALTDMYPGGPTNKIAFKVTNNSEVAVELQLYAANMTGNLPLNVPCYGTADANNPAFTAQLAPGETKDDIVYDIVWNNLEIDPMYAGKTDIIQFRVQIVQVD